MKNGRCSLVTLFMAVMLISAFPVLADRGQMYPYSVQLSEDSQRAIILWANGQETLILGTSFAYSQREVGSLPVLEFIPFPSEPIVDLAKIDPFPTAEKLAAAKKIEFLNITKGSKSMVESATLSPPVDVLFSRKLGAHDVTAVKILDGDHFAGWVKSFFKQKGFAYEPDKAVAVAKDYLARGFSYFVFDYLVLESDRTVVDPLIYRFKSDKIFYPLKTSNLVGGDGVINLMLFLPGSLGLLQDESDLIALQRCFEESGMVDVSSSAKIYPQELEDIVPDGATVFGGKPIYGQAVQYYGYYDFKDDLLLDVSHIAPFARKNTQGGSEGGGWFPWFMLSEETFVEPYTDDELADAAAAYRMANPQWTFERAFVQNLVSKGLLSKSEVR